MVSLFGAPLSPLRVIAPLTRTEPSTVRARGQSTDANSLLGRAKSFSTFSTMDCHGEAGPWAVDDHGNATPWAGPDGENGPKPYIRSALGIGDAFDMVGLGMVHSPFCCVGPALQRSFSAGSGESCVGLRLEAHVGDRPPQSCSDG
jgi:hypothetical protein